MYPVQKILKAASLFSLQVISDENFMYVFILHTKLRVNGSKIAILMCAMRMTF